MYTYCYRGVCDVHTDSMYLQLYYANCVIQYYVDMDFILCIPIMYHHYVFYMISYYVFHIMYVLYTILCRIVLCKYWMLYRTFTNQSRSSRRLGAHELLLLFTLFTKPCCAWDLQLDRVFGTPALIGSRGRFIWVGWLGETGIGWHWGITGG